MLAHQEKTTKGKGSRNENVFRTMLGRGDVCDVEVTRQFSC